MYIVTASSDGYAQHMGVMLHSLLENLDNKTDTHIFIIEANISSENKCKLERIVERFNLQAKFITVDDNLFNSFDTGIFWFGSKLCYGSKEAYYRIIIPDLLSKDITKVLYLDCDLIVEEDISTLWNINIDDYFLAATEEGIKKKRKKTLSIPKKSSYFNAGVLLINLQKWRENNIPIQVIQYIKDNPTKIDYMDQDALNAILHDKWLKLDPKWNYTNESKRRIHIENPAIIHFAGADKPWNSEHPFKKEYFKYLSSSLWEQENESI
ncbi:glycosyltransferase family 8 protein [Bacillus songklensis]|uniref:Glycosyltransferase family 8 protein n=1 Tax=Bacillus songklensis TaxID=1069116 RepID=A0ABV8BA18_9BACI